tara:strand:- start:39 stop:275 length:237 start_codon:yes stop_codon:yes gene_type:complete
MRGKDMFGKGTSIKAEVTNGHCPLCQEKTIFVSIYNNIYRCITCGGDTEQKVNGVIQYLPIGTEDSTPPDHGLKKDGS